MSEREEGALRSLSDDELLHRLSALLHASRRVEADLVAHIAEVDARRLYAREASPSMFAYCTEVLHLSEHEAYLRIAVARASREHPELLTMLRDGRLHLSAIAKLAPHLTPMDREALLARAAHKTKRQVEELIAELSPRPPAAPVVRRLPDRGTERAASPTGQLGPDRATVSHLATSPEPPAAGASTPRPESWGAHPPQLGPDRAASSTGPGSRPAVLEAVAPARYRVHFDASAELRDKLERLQSLLRSAIPGADLATVIDMAVSEKLQRLESKRFAQTARPRKTLAQTKSHAGSRQIPAAVRRFVHQRDGGRCTYRDERGRRCSARHGLEYHHHFPYALGSDHSSGGISLLCRTHNLLMAERDYGAPKMARHRRPGDRVSEGGTEYAAGRHRAPAAMG